MRLMLMVAETSVAKKISSMHEQCLGLTTNYHLLTLQMTKGHVQATMTGCLHPQHSH